MTTPPTPTYLEELPPFDFAKYGLVRGAIIKGHLVVNNQENIDGVVEKVYPKYIVIRKHSGVRTTVHYSHVLCGEVVFKVVSGKKEAM